MQAKRFKVGVSIGKQDDDIAAWYNMLKENGLSVSEWTLYLILAHLQNEDSLDIGTISDSAIRENSVPPNLFGTGNSQLDRASTPKQIQPKQSFKSGSVIVASLTNQKAISGLLNIKAQGWSYSKYIKILIRKYVKRGTVSAPPSYSVQANMIRLDPAFDAKQESAEYPISQRNHSEPKKKKQNHNQQKQDAPDENAKKKPVEYPPARTPVAELNTELGAKSGAPKEPQKTTTLHAEKRFTTAASVETQDFDFEEDIFEGAAVPVVSKEMDKPQEASGKKLPFINMIWGAK